MKNDSKDRTMSVLQPFFSALFMVYLLFRDTYKLKLLTFVPKVALFIIVAIALIINIWCIMYWKQKKDKMLFPSLMLFPATIGLSVFSTIGLTLINSYKKTGYLAIFIFPSPYHHLLIYYDHFPYF